jgi:hypothetical protein
VSWGKARRSRDLPTFSVKLLGNVLHVAILVHSLAVFVGNQISIQIDWLIANLARYFWDAVTTHKTSFGRSEVA